MVETYFGEKQRIQQTMIATTEYYFYLLIFDDFADDDALSVSVRARHYINMTGFEFEAILVPKQNGAHLISTRKSEIIDYFEL